MSTAFRVGILVVMALGNKDFLFSSTYRLKAEFQNVAGLNTGAPVRIGGIHEGTARFGFIYICATLRCQTVW